jgi:hypothetical protein
MFLFKIQHPTVLNKFASFIFIFRISRCPFPYLWRHSSMTSKYVSRHISCIGCFMKDVTLYILSDSWIRHIFIGSSTLKVSIYYEFSLLHIFSLVRQPWMSAYIRKMVWPHDVENFQGSTFCLFVMVQPWNIGVCWIDQVFVTELMVVIFDKQ